MSWLRCVVAPGEEDSIRAPIGFQVTETVLSSMLEDQRRRWRPFLILRLSTYGKRHLDLAAFALLPFRANTLVLAMIVQNSPGELSWMG